MSSCFCGSWMWFGLAFLVMDARGIEGICKRMSKYQKSFKVRTVVLRSVSHYYQSFTCLTQQVHMSYVVYEPNKVISVDDLKSYYYLFKSDNYLCSRNRRNVWYVHWRHSMYWLSRNTVFFTINDFFLFVSSCNILRGFFKLKFTAYIYLWT